MISTTTQQKNHYPRVNPYIFAGLARQPQYEYRLKIAYHLNDDRLEIVTAKIFDCLKVCITQAKSKSHKREFVEARQIAMYMVKKHLGCTLKYIGKYFGGRHHSTVKYAINTVDDMMESDPVFKKKVGDVETHAFY